MQDLVLAENLRFRFRFRLVCLGDKQNHVPVIHLAQLLYFMALTAMFMLPLVLSKRSLETGMRNMVGNAR